MSAWYKYQIEVSPCPDDDMHARLGDLGYPVSEGRAVDSGWCVEGEVSLSASRDHRERHAEIAALFPGKKVTTRWRCMDYDEWDETFGSEDDQDEVTT